jgi:hypothetical protein
MQKFDVIIGGKQHPDEAELRRMQSELGFAIDHQGTLRAREAILVAVLKLQRAHGYDVAVQLLEQELEYLRSIGNDQH